MDEVMSRLIFLVTDLILPLIVGYVLYQRRLLSDGMLNRLIRINIVAFFTLLSLFSFWALPLTKDVLVLPFFFAFIILFPGFISWRFLGRRFHSSIDRGTHLISALLSNIGTLGGICAYIIYGERGFAYAQIGSACQNLVLVLLAFPIAQYYYLLHKSHGRSARLDTRGFLGLLISWNQLSILGMAAGLLLNAAGIERPPAVGTAFEGLIHFGAWFGMLPVGALINLHRTRRYAPYTLDLFILRFLIMPAFMFAISYPFVRDPVLLGAIIVFSVTPGAINSVTAAKLYRLNVDFTISGFLTTSIAFFFLVYPALYFLLR